MIEEAGAPHAKLITVRFPDDISSGFAQKFDDSRVKWRYKVFSEMREHHKEMDTER